MFYVLCVLRACASRRIRLWNLWRARLFKLSSGGAWRSCVDFVLVAACLCFDCLLWVVLGGQYGGA
jgi:hypothetical protein